MEAGNKPKKKGTTMKTRKSLSRKQKGDYGDSDDDDFDSKIKGKKAAGPKRDGEEAKARVAANKAKIAAAAAVFGSSDNEDAEEEPRRNRISLISLHSDHSDAEMAKPAAQAKTVSKQVPPKKTMAKRKRSGSGSFIVVLNSHILYAAMKWTPIQKVMSSLFQGRSKRHWMTLSPKSPSPKQPNLLLLPRKRLLQRSCSRSPVMRNLTKGLSLANHALHRPRGSRLPAPAPRRSLPMSK
jgi:hypothetical protein